MGRRASRSSRFSTAVLLGVALAVLASCVGRGPGAPATLDPNAPVVVPYEIRGGGEIKFTVQPRYAEGQPVAVDLDLRAGSLQIIGPVSGQILEEGLAGRQQVRRLETRDLHQVEVAPGKSAHLTITWDGRDDTGAFAAAETLGLALDFIVGGDLQRFGTVLEVVPK